MADFMSILYTILDLCPDNGEPFLIEAFLKPHFDYFLHSYEFNELGEISNKSPRHFTERNKYEIDRYCRIAIESVLDYNDKDNRNTNPDLLKAEQNQLDTICAEINSGVKLDIVKKHIVDLMTTIQNRQIRIIERSL